MGGRKSSAGSTAGSITGSHYDPVRGETAVRFFEKVLVHAAGKHAGQPFILEPWEREGIIKPLFGTVKADGTRQYRIAYVEIPRGNGKSTLAAGIASDARLTIVFTEHDMDVVFAVARRITVLHQGSVIAEGTPLEVRANAEVQRVYLGQQTTRAR